MKLIFVDLILQTPIRCALVAFLWLFYALFPYYRVFDSIASSKVEEERRLCYVGITRAKEQLYLTRARNRILWGMLRTMNRSRFLYEIPRELVSR